MVSKCSGKSIRALPHLFKVSQVLPFRWPLWCREWSKSFTCNWWFGFALIWPMHWMHKGSCDPVMQYSTEYIYTGSYDQESKKMFSIILISQNCAFQDVDHVLRLRIHFVRYQEPSFAMMRVWWLTFVSLCVCTACGAMCDCGCAHHLQHHAGHVPAAVHVCCHWGSALQGKQGKPLTLLLHLTLFLPALSLKQLWWVFSLKPNADHLKKKNFDSLKPCL